MNAKKWMAVAFIVLAITALACNISANPSNSGDSGGDQGGDAVELARQTLAAEQTQTAANQPPTAVVQAPTEQQQQAAPPTETPVPTDTPLPTATFTATPTNTPDKTTITVSENTNCRSGPGTVYDLVGFLTVGIEAEVIGWDGFGEYYIIKDPDNGRECWLWSHYATVVGSTDRLKVYQSPPTPTPVAIWEGTWTMKIEGNTYTIKINQKGLNISGAFKTTNNDTINFSGKVSEDQLVATGSWENTSNNVKGTFRWEMLSNKKQFIGEGINESNVAGEWCGGRDGSGPPSPCELP